VVENFISSGIEDHTFGIIEQTPSAVSANVT